MRPDIAYFRDRLTIDKGRLDDELIAQPALLHLASEQRTQWMSLVEQSKDALRGTTAKLSNRHRRKLERSGEKVTEARITRLVESDEEFVRCASELAERRNQLAEWEVMVEAIRSRGFALRDLIELWVAGYWSDSHSASRKVLDERAESNRRAMAGNRRVVVRKGVRGA